MKPVFLYLMVLLYLYAGYNHFANPGFYTKIIPSYLSQWRSSINIISGIVEIILAVGLLFPFTRTYAAYGIIMMLIAFIPSHIYMIQLGFFKLGKFQVTPIIGWIRLLIIHPLLIGWAWWLKK